MKALMKIVAAKFREYDKDSVAEYFVMWEKVTAF